MALVGEPLEPLREEGEDVDVHERCTRVAGLVRAPRQAEEVEADLDAPLGGRHPADGVFDHRHEQRLATLGRADLERLAGGQLDQAHDGPEAVLAVEHLAALEFMRPPFALGELWRIARLDGQLAAAQGLDRRAAVDALQAQDRPLRRCPRDARSRRCAPATLTRAPSASRRGFGPVT